MFDRDFGPRSRLQRTVPGSASSPEEPEPRPEAWGKRCGKARRPRPPQEGSCGCCGSPDVSRASPDVVGRWAGPRTRPSIGSCALPAEAFGSVTVPTTPVMELTPLTSLLRGHRVVLASTSPRRRDILELAGLKFDVIPSRFEEVRVTSSRCPGSFALEMATGKAMEVAHRMCPADQLEPVVVIGADTVVAVDGRILGKPSDQEEAFWMLSSLSGKEHGVFTGVALVTWSGRDLEPKVRGFFEETRVTFSRLSEALIREYVDTGEPMDKAGAYGLQARGAMLVEHVVGDFLNVAGFPLNRFCRELQGMLTGNNHLETGNM
ncbi:probable bifunctional dTTP/UTP pyrophosphatase/methyltransferase protein isoform X2 [Psammomys obesus]|uniref:probable bifunctional dTTP/UTP pyrophosphatase/methyltransferase protein isoform X2 n=1 Tax=Psammomys obesus TaxID=48139 RepID=UPI002452B0B3|nr:probable bifunctional dTTP/UTP pyrophosphatase/methyltransferase protein isoform X2 [Psammomys obesus]XP_055461185.1 probable bifunctional dTTP/UTP pyrophosphatase/methyltransferase protein isoform X2 [Psammomys obesus]